MATASVIVDRLVFDRNHWTAFANDRSPEWVLH
jgi:hypothetical protein